jgi:AraC-like DNA-binding protein
VQAGGILVQNKIFLNNLSLHDIAFVYTYTATADKYPMKNKGRFHNGFLYTLIGTETYHFKDHSVQAVPDSVLYIPKGESYKITLDGEKSVVITIDFEISGKTTKPFRVDFSEINAIKSCFQDIEMKWERKKTNYKPECKSYFYRIISMLSKQISPVQQTSKFDIIETAEHYLRENYLRNDFRIEHLSETAGISRRYFEILFQRKYNITPKAYILSLKIERAKELLLSEKLMIKDIAIMLGYSDIYHFGKIFKKKTGYTPSEYRRTHGL